jgi:hypothetical protein
VNIGLTFLWTRAISHEWISQTHLRGHGCYNIRISSALSFFQWLSTANASKHSDANNPVGNVAYARYWTNTFFTPEADEEGNRCV